MAAKELKDLPEIKAMLDLARNVVQWSERMGYAGVGDLGELEIKARKVLETWDAADS